MCLADINLSAIDPVADGPAVADGLIQDASACRADQAALSARLLIAATVIEQLLSRLQTSEFAARTNAETIQSMRREHAKEIRELEREAQREIREAARDAAAEERWSQQENGGW